MASAGAAPAQASDQPQAMVAIVKPSLFTRISSGPACFYWIAALTLLNSIVTLFGFSLHFVIGMGITSAIDARAKELGVLGAALDLIINGTIAGIFFLLGNLSSKRIKWAFIAGMVLYGLDGLLLLAAQDVLSATFHAYSLFMIWIGMKACERV